MNSTFTQGTINITINNTPLEIPDPAHPTFSLFSASSLSTRSVASFLVAICGICIRTLTRRIRTYTARDLTQSQALPFQLEGQARAVANMSIGQITLDPIKFNVSSGLSGLQGLEGRVTIDSVDVLGGSTEAIHLGIGGESPRDARCVWD